MAYQYSVTLRNAQLTAISTAVGGAASLRIYQEVEPANVAAAEPATLLCKINLPASPFAAASGGSMTMAGTWSGTGSASASANCFRIYDAVTAGNCVIQGNVTTDLVLNNTSITSGQTVSVTQFTVTCGNA